MIILLLGLAGRNHLLTYLQNFLSLLGYWSTVFFVIIFSEHIIFRKGDIANYNLEGWNNPDLLPRGYAAFGAFCCGVIAFVMGMVRQPATRPSRVDLLTMLQSETWYVGPLAESFNKPYGADLANEFALVVTCVVFIPLRYVEKKYVGR